MIELLPGIDGGISSEVPQAFNSASTTHIIAISGFKLLPIVDVGIPTLRTYQLNNMSRHAL